MRSFKTFAVSSIVTLFTLTGCSSGETTVAPEVPESIVTQDSDLVTLRVGASASPHAQILNYIAENHAEDAGLNIQIVEFTDYITPNMAVDTEELDANYFQTIPYLEDQMTKGGYDLVHGEGIHLEPLGIYSEKYKNIERIPDDANIGIIQDPTNQERALTLLAGEGFVELPQDGIVNVATVKPLRGASFVEVEGPSLVRNLVDVDIAVINGNFALAGGLLPAQDALILEEPVDNPSVNVLVWKKDSKNMDALTKLEELLHSDDVREYIEKNWQNGSVIPAF